MKIGPGEIPLNLNPYFDHSTAKDLIINQILKSIAIHSIQIFSNLVIATTPALAEAEGNT